MNIISLQINDKRYGSFKRGKNEKGNDNNRFTFPFSYMRYFCIEKYDNWKIRNINSGQIWSNMDLFNSMYILILQII